MGEKYEKKSTLCVNLKYVDPKTGKLSPKVEYKDKENPIEKSAMKTISAFGNTKGGTLVIGVADDNSIVGIDADFELKQFPNQDKWELHLKNCLKRIKPNEYRKKIVINYHQSEGKTICVIDCPIGNSLVTYNGTPWWRSGPDRDRRPMPLQGYVPRSRPLRDCHTTAPCHRA